MAGIVATLVAIPRHRRVLRAKAALRFLRRSARTAPLRAAQLARAIRPRLIVLRTDLSHMRQLAVRAAITRLRQMVPSRRTVLRLTQLTIGIALVAYAMFGFAAGNVVLPFVFMTIGYFTVASYWLMRGRVHDSQSDANDPLDATSISRVSATQAVHSTQLLSLLAPRALSNKDADLGHDRPRPADRLSDRIDDVRQSIRAERESRRNSALKQGDLRCDGCGKHFNIRGEGEIGPRTIPCPQCSSTLQPQGAARTTADECAANGTEITSVVCRKCRAIIDVPSTPAVISAACPRCDAELPVRRLLQQLVPQIGV
jgi:hypothetical protein